MRTPRAPINREQHVAAVQAMVGYARRLFITDMVGQEMVYLKKEQEARAFLAADAPAVSHYRFIAADAKRFGKTPVEAAEQIVAKADMFTVLADGMETIRGKAEDAIAAATSIAEAEDAVKVAKAELTAFLKPFGAALPLQA